MMDVTDTDYDNVQAVNFLCVIWAIMCWSVMKHLHFPDDIKLKPIQINPKKISIVKVEDSEKEYSDPISEGIEDEDDD